MADLIIKSTMERVKDLMVTYSGRKNETIGIKLTKSRKQFILLMDIREFTEIIHQILHETKGDGIQK